MNSYRALTIDEIVRLKAQACVAEDWTKIQVSEGFRTEAIYDVRFSGEIRMGAFDEDIVEHEGFVAYSGIRHATLHNVTVGDGCLIENVGSYISNYDIGHQCYIRNIGSMMTTGNSTFGNGVTVAALNESGRHALPICEGLPAPVAYVMATDRFGAGVSEGLRRLVKAQAAQRLSARGRVGDGAFICDTRQIVNVNIGNGCAVNGAAKLTNGTLVNEGGRESTVGADVIAQDFILSGGATLDAGAIVTRCFVGQGSLLGSRFTATDSFIASNCHFENGEAVSIFAGPFTVSHHKNTLLIAGLFSFMNAGSGTNQSNHLYKTGPIHQGELLRGSKTASSSHLVWPARLGAYTMVMGRVKDHPDTSAFPFSYVIGEEGKTWLVPGANFCTVGTWRDTRKWPQRDKRVPQAGRDLIRYDLLTPYVLQSALAGYRTLQRIQACDYVGQELRYRGLDLRLTSVAKGAQVYAGLLTLGFSQAFAAYLQRRTFSTGAEFREFIRPKTTVGQGEWVDLAGFIAPSEALAPIWNAVEADQIEDLDELLFHLQEVDEHYEEYAWSWAYPQIQAMDEGFGDDVAAYLALNRQALTFMQEVTNRVIRDAGKDVALAGGDADSDIQHHPFVQAMQAELKEVQTTVEDVENCIGELGK
jgi:hypothetical protein